MLLLTDLLKCCCALCETSLFPHHCICKVLNIVPKLSPLFSVSHKCLAEVSLSNVIFSLFSRLPEAPQAVIKQRQEVPRPQARVRAPRAHPPAQGGAPSPCALQAPQLGQPPHPATIRNQHTWTNYGTPSHIQGLSKSTQVMYQYRFSWSVAPAATFRSSTSHGFAKVGLGMTNDRANLLYFLIYFECDCFH